MLELLVVIAILVVVTGLSGALWKGRAKAGPAGATLASCIEVARSNAMANDRLVWLRVAPSRKEPEHLELRFFRTRDGDNNEDSVTEFRRPVRLEQMAIRRDLPDFGGRPKADMSGIQETGVTVIVRATGEAEVIGEIEGFPLPEDELVPFMEIGLQAVRGAGRPVEGDMVAVQIPGLSGTPVVYSP